MRGSEILGPRAGRVSEEAALPEDQNCSGFASFSSAWRVAGGCLGRRSAGSARAAAIASSTIAEKNCCWNVAAETADSESKLPSVLPALFSFTGGALLGVH